MRKLSGKLKIYLYSGIALAAISLILFTLALIFAYDSTVNYFDSSLFISVAVPLVAISALLAVSAFVFLPKGELDGASPLTLPVIIPSALAAIAFLGIGTVMLLCGLGSKETASVFTGFSLTNPVVSYAGIFCIIAALYFIFNCFVKDDAMSKPHLLLGYTVPIAAVLLIAVSYFDITVSMNAPAKQLFHLTLISFMVWFIYELRVMLGKAQPRCYLAFGLITITLSGCASFPWLISYAIGKLSAPLYPTYLLYNIIALAIFAYSIVRVCVFVCARDLLERISDQTPDDFAFESEKEEDVNND